jgi:hypothetical protein
MIADTVRTKIGFQSGSLPSGVSKLIHLPIRLAGLGLRSQSATAPVAHLSSLALAASDITRVQSAAHGAPVLSTDAAISDSYTRLRHTGYFDRPRKEEEKQLPSNPSSFLDLFVEGGARGLQHAVLADIELSDFRSLLDAGTEEDRARLLSCSEPGSGAWITAVPSEQEYRMSDAGYRFAVRLRLGLPPVDSLPQACVCGAALSANHNHFLVCQSLKATSMTTRHDHIVRSFAALARASGAEVIVEPSFDSDRPDAEISWADGVDLVDVSVTHAGLSALQRGSAREPLRAARTRELMKIARYAALVRDYNARFVPLVFETYGALGEGTQHFISKLNSARLAQPDARSLPDQTGLIMQRLAVALQNGNARVQDEGLRRARGHACGIRPPRSLRHATGFVRRRRASTAATGL